MAMKQGDLELLKHPASRELLKSNIPTRLAYVWTDGTPRVVPIWFHWDGRAFVLATPPKAPKLKALARNPKVALTIDDNNFPHKVLLVRGSAHLETVDGIVPEYAAAAERYFGREQGQAWVSQVRASNAEDGAYRHRARMGRPPGFPDSLSQCAFDLTQTGLSAVD